MSRDALCSRTIAAADVADLVHLRGTASRNGDIPAYHTMADALFAALNASRGRGTDGARKNHQLLSRRAAVPCFGMSGEAARVMEKPPPV